MRTALFLLFSTALLAGTPPAQDPLPPPDTRAPPSKVTRAANKKLQARMQGAWRLLEIQLAAVGKAGFGDRRLEHTGYCLVGDGYLSIEFHLRLIDQGENDWGRSLVSGLHRFVFDGASTIETTSVIATKTNAYGGPEFEAPGEKRIYDVGFEGQRMVLTRDDGHRLVFEPLLEGRQRFDIFGRPIRDEDDANGDGAKKDDSSRAEGDKKGDH